MENLKISGETGQLDNWNVDDVIKPLTSSKQMDIARMLQYEWDNTISRCGMTYLEIEQFNNTYNNF
jgi:hypothetical protein